jgi:hypothetical protein
MGRKLGNEGKTNLRVILIVNLILVMFLSLSLFTFMVILRPTTPGLPKIWLTSIYLFVLVLTGLTGITAAVIFRILKKGGGF